MQRQHLVVFNIGYTCNVAVLITFKVSFRMPKRQAVKRYHRQVHSVYNILI